MRERMTWTMICRQAQLQGLWVALDHCRYDQATLQPIEGEVVDADEDLATLCARMRSSDRGHCAVRFCDGTPEAPLPSEYPSHPSDSAAVR